MEKLSQLEEIARRCSVQLIGWDFPHIGNEAMTRGDGWVGLTTDFNHHRESWRLLQSGQFAFLGGLRSDWRDHSDIWPPDDAWKAGAVLTIYEALYKYTEIFEFAARLAVSPAGGSHMVIDIALVGLVSRRLIAGTFHRMDSIQSHVAGVQSHQRRVTVPTESLVAAPRDYAMDAAIGLFEKFSWDTDRRMMQSFLDELKR